MFYSNAKVITGISERKWVGKLGDYGWNVVIWLRERLQIEDYRLKSFLAGTVLPNTGTTDPMHKMFLTDVKP